MAPLDGKEKVAPVPFDAHERATRGEHVATTKDSPDKDPKTVQQYPKAVDHVDGKPIVVNNAEEEAAYHESKKEEAE